jgi:hypothetical protein
METGVKEGSSLHESMISQRREVKRQKQLFIPFFQERDGLGRLITEPEYTSVLHLNHNSSSLSYANGVECSLPIENEVIYLSKAAKIDEITEIGSRIHKKKHSKEGRVSGKFS